VKAVRRIALLLLGGILAGCVSLEDAPVPSSKEPIAPSKTAPETPPATGEAGTDLNALRSYALAQSPHILAADRATLVALARARQAGLFPNPIITYSFTDFRLGGGSGGPSAAQHYLGVSAAFPMSDRIEMARREAESGAELARVGVDLARRELIVQLDEALATYLGVQERLDIFEEQAKRLEALEAEEKRRVDAGTGLEPDLLGVRVETAKARLEVESIGRAVTASRQILRAMVGKDLPWERLDAKLPRDAPPLDADGFLEKARAESPSIIELEQQAVTARATLARARAEAYPDFTVAFGGGYDGNAHDPVIQGGIAVPIPLFNRNQYAVEAALRDLERAERSVLGERIVVTIACSEAARDYEVARARVRAYRDRIIPAAQQARKSALDSYGAAKPGVAAHDVLAAERALLAAEREASQARVDLAIAVARIERLTGAPVPEKR
jgi:cobalt-zinc-cadmium efflux system outer membrane protein